MSVLQKAAIRKSTSAKLAVGKPAGKALIDKRVELLFEIGCEEIPAGMLPKADQREARDWSWQSSEAPFLS